MSLPLSLPLSSPHVTARRLDGPARAAAFAARLLVGLLVCVICGGIPASVLVRPVVFERSAPPLPERDGAERDASIALYERAAAYALTKGIIIADTKFEFGLDETGRLTLMDEVLTPDSSRFWPADTYQVGTSPPSFDKQYVRDYLETLDWDKRAPGPALPAAIIAATRDKYRDALQRLTG